MPILTISRQMASYGDEIAQVIAKKTGWELLTRDIALKRFFMEKTSKNTYHLLQNSARSFLTLSESGLSYRNELEKELLALTSSQSAILVGFGSQVIFADHPEAVHLRIIAPEAVRVRRVADLFHLTPEDAATIVTTADKKHRRFVSTVFSADLTDPDWYDLVLNTADLSVETCTATILTLLDQINTKIRMQRQTAGQHQEQPDRPGVIEHQTAQPLFKNKSEEAFARILDMYQIDWVYEPRTFPIEWDAEGNVTLAFSPDFYLPRFNTYLELTTMSQKYVTRKNKKAKKLQELYPGIHVRIVYRKNFQSLLERFKSSDEP